MHEGAEMRRNRHTQRTWGRASGLVALIAGVLLALPASAAAADHMVFVADDANIDAVANSVGADIDQRFTHVARGFVADLTPLQIRRLNADSRVVETEQDAVFTLMPFKRSPFKRSPFKRSPFKRSPFKRSPFKRSDYGSPYYSQISGTSTSRVGAAQLNLPPVNADIAILDTGVDAGHPDLNVAGAVSCVPREGTRDYDGHGTMIAGLAAAKDNRIGIKGVAPGARIWSVKVADAGGTVMESSALCGLEWVAANAARLDVANMSWAGEGVPTGNNCSTVVAPAPERTRKWRLLNFLKRGYFPWRNKRDNKVDPASIDAIEALICKANDAGVTLVAAAGNDALSANGFLPASFPDVLAVSSMSDTDGKAGGLGPDGCLTDDPDDTFSSFSNDGSVIDIAAPGECLATTDTGSDYAIGSGTSYAAGVVSGAVALSAGTARDHQPDLIRAHLLATAEPGPIAGDVDGSPEGILHVTS